MEPAGQEQKKSRFILLYRLLCFWLPLFMLLLFGSALLHSVYRIRNIDHNRLSHDLNMYLTSRHENRNIFDLPERLEQIEQKQKNILLFGASSVVIGPEGRRRVFANYLQRRLVRLGIDARVFNMGINSIDSFDILSRLEQTTDRLENMGVKPDLIILYLGHNDYINSFYISLPMIDQLPALRLLLFPVYAYNLLVDRSFNLKFLDGHFTHSFSPPFIKMLQYLPGARLDPQPFLAYKDIILESYSKNIETMLNIADSLDIPVIISTLICNLEIEPYGDIRTATKYFNLGMSTEDYEKRLTLLQKARDYEIFSSNNRAVTDTNNYIRTLASHHNTFVFDLEKLLLEEEFAFGYRNFIDHLHMAGKTHRKIGLLLGNFIADSDIM